MREQPLQCAVDHLDAGSAGIATSCQAALHVVEQACGLQELLRQRLLSAQHEVAQLKSLLSDYGLIWLGTPRATNESASTQPGTPVHSDSGELTSCSDLWSGDKIAASAKAQKASVTQQAIAESPPSPALPVHAARSWQQTAPLLRLENSGAEESHSGARAACHRHLLDRAAPQLYSPAWVAKCYIHLQCHVGELNAQLHTGIYQLHRDTSSLASAVTSVQLIVWQNGLQLHQLPFMPWISRSCSLILRDIVEGALCGTCAYYV